MNQVLCQFFETWSTSLLLSLYEFWKWNRMILKALWYCIQLGSTLRFRLPDVQPSSQQAKPGPSLPDHRWSSEDWTEIPYRGSTCPSHRHERRSYDAVHRVRRRQASSWAEMWKGTFVLFKQLLYGLVMWLELKKQPVRRLVPLISGRIFLQVLWSDIVCH